MELDNFSFLNISKLRDEEDFDKPYKIILKYLRIVLTNYDMYSK